MLPGYPPQPYPTTHVARAPPHLRKPTPTETALPGRHGRGAKPRAGGPLTRSISDTWYGENLTEGWLTVTLPIMSGTPGRLRAAPPTSKTSPPNANAWPNSAWPPSGCISTTGWAAPHVPGPDSISPSPLSELATPWSCRSSIVSHGRCRMPLPSATTAPSCSPHHARPSTAHSSAASRPGLGDTQPAH